MGDIVKFPPAYGQGSKDSSILEGLKNALKVYLVNSGSTAYNLAVNKDFKSINQLVSNTFISAIVLKELNTTTRLSSDNTIFLRTTTVEVKLLHKDSLSLWNEFTRSMVEQGWTNWQKTTQGFDKNYGIYYYIYEFKITSIN